jgi:hypothetical protein
MFVNVRVREKCSLMRKTSTAMADDDLRDQIARLESDIEQLAESLERCRKVMLVSQMVIATGAIGLLAYLLGAIRFEPTLMIGAIAALIGGVVLYGSNSSTSKEAMAAMKDAEALRTELIDSINLQTVAGNSLNPLLK